jgi:uncharacterized protein with HEPN domain
MRDYAREAAELSRDKTREDLNVDRVLSLALVHLVQIVGEAARRVSPENRKKLPQIPWSQIIGFRNIVVHAYDDVDYDILWSVLEMDLPALVNQLEEALREDP